MVEILGNPLFLALSLVKQVLADKLHYLHFSLEITDTCKENFKAYI